MAQLQYTVARLPEKWPGTPTPSLSRGRPPFKSMWTRTLEDLEREVRMLGGRDVVIAVDVTDYDLRADGQLRVNAKIRTPGVILSFRNGKGERYEFPCDRFAYWQDNLDAIARAMEDLRRIDRYGVKSGRQYEGFKALPAKTEETMATTRAAEIIAQHSLANMEAILRDSELATHAIRAARAKTHPDSGGSTNDFTLVAAAKRSLEAHFGRAL